MMLWLMNAIIKVCEWLGRVTARRERRKNIKNYKEIIKARDESAGRVDGLRCSAFRCNLCGGVFNKIHESRKRFHQHCPHCGAHDSKLIRPLEDEEIKKLFANRYKACYMQDKREWKGKG